MKRSKQAAQETRAHLIQAACRVFYKEGVARATLEQISREAGLTRGALYWHFNNKVEILDALFQTVMPHLNELDDCVEQLDGGDYWSQLEQYYVKFFDDLSQNVFLRQFCTVMHLKCEMTESNHQVVALLSRYRHSWEERIDEIVKKAVKVGALPDNTDVVNMAAVLRSHLVGLMVTHLSDLEYGREVASVPSPVLQLQYVFRIFKQSPMLRAAP